MVETPKPGSIVHVELIAEDTAGVKKFFGSLFGWKFEDMPQMNYTMWTAPGGLSGGLMTPKPEAPGTGQPLNYIYVESIDGMAPKIESAGGKIVVPKTEIPGMGWFAFFSYPEGMIWGLYESARRPSRGGSGAKSSSKKAKSGKARRK
jgi:hypothetical protein